MITEPSAPGFRLPAPRSRLPAPGSRLLSALAPDVRIGTKECPIHDDGVSVGPVTIAFLDADTPHAADHRIEIGCWPSGALVLTELGRRFDACAAELRRARDHALSRSLG